MFTPKYSLLVLSISISTSAFASGGSHGLPAQGQKLDPAGRYSGRTPVDMKHGLLFNNGTYGAPNANYEKWATTKTVVPGVSELNYAYADKADFVSGLEESARFIEAAINNWKSTTEITKPEAKEYSERAASTMQPLLDGFRNSIRQAAGAGSSDWDKAQADARRSLVELRATYANLHRNVR